MVPGLVNGSSHIRQGSGQIFCSSRGFPPSQSQDGSRSSGQHIRQRNSSVQQRVRGPFSSFSLSLLKGKTSPRSPLPPACHWSELGHIHISKMREGDGIVLFGLDKLSSFSRVGPIFLDHIAALKLVQTSVSKE